MNKYYGIAQPHSYRYECLIEWEMESTSKIERFKQLALDYAPFIFMGTATIINLLIIGINLAYA